jgi:hypothetical protein
MIARKVCLFPLDNLSPTAARIPSWLLLMGNSSDTKRTAVTAEALKGARRG